MQSRHYCIALGHLLQPQQQYQQVQLVQWLLLGLRLAQWLLALQQVQSRQKGQWLQRYQHFQQAQWLLRFRCYQQAQLGQLHQRLLSPPKDQRLPHYLRFQQVQSVQLRQRLLLLLKGQLLPRYLRYLRYLLRPKAQLLQRGQWLQRSQRGQ